MPRKSETARRNKIKLRDARFEDKKQTKTFSFKPEKKTRCCACESHNIKQLPYLKWHEWAESLDKKGIKQVQCEKCKRWFFPEKI
jgi:hypothetical protein